LSVPSDVPSDFSGKYAPATMKSPVPRNEVPGGAVRSANTNTRNRVAELEWLADEQVARLKELKEDAELVRENRRDTRDWRAALSPLAHTGDRETP
jgi:hypothetical protein